MAFSIPQSGAGARRVDAEEGISESYDRARLLSFLSDVKAGRSPVRAPVYSHLTYDIVPNQWQEVDQPDILIVEGVNVLQTAPLPHHGRAVPVVSDFFDFSVYIDADVSVLRDWYVKRFLTFRDTAFHDPRSYFHRYSLLSDDEAIATATAIWERTNFANLAENILPTRPRVDADPLPNLRSRIETVALRRFSAGVVDLERKSAVTLLHRRDVFAASFAIQATNSATRLSLASAAGQRIICALLDAISQLDDTTRQSRRSARAS